MPNYFTLADENARLMRHINNINDCLQEDIPPDQQIHKIWSECFFAINPNKEGSPILKKRKGHYDQ